MTYSPNILWIRRLIWTYFWLLLFEGVLRKWVVPSLSAPLLLIRAPIVIAIYFLAIQARVFPFTRWVQCCTVLALLALFAGLYVLQDAPIVALFGFQADFLQLPLIFIIPRAFDIQDVRKIGFWTLVMCLPMALVMVLQFKASSTAWINAGAGQAAAQLAAADGHIRPAALFTYITGPASFFPVVAAFLLSSQFLNMRYPRWLMLTSTLAFLIGSGVSSSRTLAASVGIVIACSIVTGIILKPVIVSERLLMRTAQALCLLLIVAVIVSHIPVFSEGLVAFSDRIDMANGGEANTGGFTGRIASGFTEPFGVLGSTPALGNGLGLGTNAGSALVNEGEVKYMLAETEWDRVILESGPFLGLAYLAWRVALFVWLGWMAIRVAKQGNVLPFLLFGSSCSLLLTGQFGQPTELGFAVLGSGLTLAAMNMQTTVQPVVAVSRSSSAELAS